MAARKKERIRAFVALDLEPMSLRRVVRVSDRLRMGSGAPSAAWTPSKNLHVTLQFAGDLAVDAIEPLGKALAPLAEGKPAPAPSALRLSAFPSAEKARVVVVELVDASGAVAKLAEKVAKITAKHGVVAEDREFRPHVTIARLRLAYDARRWLRLELAEVAGECRAASMTLYESQPGDEEPTYVPRGRWAFAAPE